MTTPLRCIAISSFLPSDGWRNKFPSIRLHSNSLLQRCPVQTHPSIGIICSFGSKKPKEKLTKQQLTIRRLQKVMFDNTKEADQVSAWTFEDDSVESEHAIGIDNAPQSKLKGMEHYLREIDESIKDFEENLTKSANTGISIEQFERISVGTRDGIILLKDASQIVIRSPTLVTFTIYDHGLINAVMRALHQTDHTWNPQDEGKGLIKLQLPKVTAETRNIWFKQAKDLAEQVKVKIRDIRRQGRIEIKNIHQNVERQAPIERDFQKAIEVKIANIDKLLNTKLRT
ncbi:ribosome recycling factor protein [Cardiosporidium cionae]|uniref:Ribosome recycling factor protein n=1 Tax=Cardiosporidium cionae TaxID=476202 RepID=A0ABQ7JD99_9APIC|nr:ribosome recycling factor protein [Cardiosporidium cionae]|eukprot:KAF8821997.1 ribosome recycling factor protein [Cardiosporidium cionae]